MPGLGLIMLNDLPHHRIDLTDAGVQFDAALAPYVQVKGQHLALQVPASGFLRILVMNAAPEFSLRIHLEAGARLEYGLISAQSSAQKMQIEAHCLADAHLVGEHALLNAASYHESYHIQLEGKAASLTLRGLEYGQEQAVLVHQLRVDHAADDTRSDIEFRGVAADQSRVVFNGLIHVPKHIKGVDANEQTRNILLSNRAEIDAKPELEIYSHDIACRHGASIGNLDQNALFYLQSRGFALEEARKILINAFVESVFDLIRIAPR